MTIPDENARRKMNGCDTCIHKAAESADDDGNRIVDCDINEFQMFSPLVDECVRWEKSEDDQE